VLIPAPAVQRGPQGPYVYIAAANGTAQMRPVTLGDSEGSDIQVTSGVAPGDMVITDGQDKLQENAKIEVRPENAPGAFPGGGGRQGGRRTQTGAVTGGGGPQGQGNADRAATPDASGIPAGRPVRGGRSQ
jgi:membrane fusion protein, multidrug efflux system